MVFIQNFKQFYESVIIYKDFIKSIEIRLYLIRILKNLMKFLRNLGIFNSNCKGVDKSLGVFNEEIVLKDFKSG